MSKYLSPTSDIVFKKVFASVKNKSITIELLNVLLGKKGDECIEDIYFLDDVHIPDSVKKKITYVDLRCKDKLGNQYIVEMQVAAESGFFQRAQYYHASAIAGQLKKKEKYDSLMPVYFIGILDFVLFDEYTDFMNVFVLKHDKTNTVHKNTLGSYTFVELPKFKKKESQLSSHVDAWINLFKRADQERDVPQQFQVYSAVSDAYFAISAANFTDSEQRAYQKELDVLRMEQSRLDTALEKGMQEGERKKAIETAQKMLGAGMQIEQISQFTGLDIEAVKALKK